MSDRRLARPVLLALVLLTPAPAELSAQPTMAPADLPAGLARTPRNRHPRLDSVLNRIVASVERDGERAAAARAPLSRETSVAVTIQFAGPPAGRDALLAGRAIVASVAGDLVEAYVPVRELAALEQLPGVIRVRAIVPPQTLATSQGTTVHNAAAWNTAGFNGAGVKVGIIDVGFVGYGALIGLELPPPAGVRCYTGVGTFTSDLNHCQTVTSHGTAVAEAVVDIAPAVSLYLSQPASYSDLASAAQWMVSQGVTVINHSVGWTWAGPGDGTSIYGNSPLAAVNTAVAGGSLWVNAAGNAARSTWTGPYQNQDSDAFLEIAPGMEVNAVFLFAGERLVVQARWEDAWGTATRDLNLYVLNGSLQFVAGSEDVQDGSPGSVPFELLQYTAPASATYYVVLTRWSVPSLPGWIQVQNFTGQGLTYFSPAFSISNPAETPNPGALAVGATPWYDTSTIEPFSSQGPTTDGRVKPDVTAVDRGDSSTYGSGAFAGTSQAAPHIAGLAALVLDQQPTFTAADLATYLKSNAQPRGSPHPNSTWGWGLVVLPTPTCTYALSPTAVSMGAGGGPGAATLTANCAWTAESNASWITVTGSSSGTGNAVITFSVASNVTHNSPSPSRTGTLTIAGQLLTVMQQGCGFSVSPTATTFGAGGGSGAVEVMTGEPCTWSVGSVPPWVSTTSGSSGSGAGTWRYAVGTNGSGQSRAAVASIAGVAFTLGQLAAPVRAIAPGARASVSLADDTAERWLSIETEAARSYCVHVGQAQAETARATPALAAFRADGVTQMNVGPVEGAALPATCFIPPATETGLIRLRQADASARDYLLSAEETTLWSNWFFIGGDYSSFTILRNTTSQPVTARITWRDAAGLAVGQHAVVVPARGVVYRDARLNVSAGTTAGTVEVAHDGRSSSLVGSQTTLSATTGLSFDAILRSRVPW